MANSLFETLKTKLNPSSANATSVNAMSGVGEQTGGLRSLLAAKSGKQTDLSSGPVQSNVQEQQQDVTNSGALSQLAQAGTAQNLAQEQTEQNLNDQANQQKQTIDLKRQEQNQTYQSNVNNLFNEINRADKQLDNQNYVDKLEQLGFNLRLTNDQYVDKLNQTAEKQRLDNSFNFKAQLAADIFKGQTELLNNQFEFKKFLDMGQSEYQDWLANLDINRAVEIASNAAKQQSAETLFKGAGNLAETGIKAYDKINETSK